MKFLFIGNQSATILLFRKKLIEKLVGAGDEVYTLTMDADREKFDMIEKIGAIPGRYLFSRSGMNPLSDFINTIRLSRQIKKIKPDVVFCFFPKPVIFGAMAARLAGIKNVNVLLEGLGYGYTIHASNCSFKKKTVRFIQTFLYKKALPLAKKVMFLNNDDYQDLVLTNKISIKSAEIVGGIGVDLKTYSYVSADIKKIHFIMVARLLIDKGVREYVSAAKIVKEKYPNVRFSIAGGFDDNPGGISRDEYEHWISQGNVEFLGQISDIKSYLASGSIFVLPSYREGVPRSTQEAMAVGRAIITTDVPGCRETVIDGYNGFIIPPWNIDALAKKMLTFIENTELINKMGAASRILAEQRFDEEKACAKLIDIMMS